MLPTFDTHLSLSQRMGKQLAGLRTDCLETDSNIPFISVTSQSLEKLVVGGNVQEIFCSDSINVVSSENFGLLVLHMLTEW